MTARTRPPAMNIAALLRQSGRTVDNVTVMFERSQDPETILNCIRMLDYVILSLERVDSVIVHRESYEELLASCKDLMAILQSVEPPDPSPDMAYRAGTLSKGRRDITATQLQFLMENQFSNGEMAECLGVSRRTINNRLKEFGLSQKALYSTITDGELDAMVKVITDENKNKGYRAVRSQLLSDGVKVPYARVHASMQRIDPAAIAMRLGKTIKRRKYKVRGPNSFWHFDGNHKLVHWKFVIHGCCDGHTRYLIYCRVAGNNKAKTVLEFFKGAVHDYGLPSRIRCDKGKENTAVVTWMSKVSGRERNSCIVGPSTGNQRIERLWRDEFAQCSSVWYDLFMDMEEALILSRASELQLWALHYTFMGRIQESMDTWGKQWNVHPIRTANSQCPSKMFIKGVLQQARQPSTGVSRFIDHMSNVGSGTPRVPIVDPADVDPVPGVHLMRSQKEVSTLPCPISREQLATLRQRINPMTDSQDGKGIDVYLKVLDYIAECQA